MTVVHHSTARARILLNFDHIRSRGELPPSARSQSTANTLRNRPHSKASSVRPFPPR